MLVFKGFDQHPKHDDKTKFESLLYPTKDAGELIGWSGCKLIIPIPDHTMKE